MLSLLSRVEQQKNSLLIEMNDTRAAVEELNMEKVKISYSFACSKKIKSTHVDVNDSQDYFFSN